MLRRSSTRSWLYSPIGHAKALKRKSAVVISVIFICRVSAGVTNMIGNRFVDPFWSHVQGFNCGLTRSRWRATSAFGIRTIQNSSPPIRPSLGGANSLNLACNLRNDRVTSLMSVFIVNQFDRSMSAEHTPTMRVLLVAAATRDARAQTHDVQQTGQGSVIASFAMRCRNRSATT